MQIDFDIFDSLCSEKGKSQSAAAEEAGVSKNAIGRWRSGEVIPSKASIKKIADYFGVSVNHLLGVENKKNPATDEGNGISEKKAGLIKKVMQMSDDELEKLEMLLRIVESK